MLFLAVTAGFFVENLREHNVEAKREKQYIKSFIEDLKMDTSSLSEWIKIIHGNRNKIDSLIYFVRTSWYRVVRK